MRALLGTIDDPALRSATEAERSFLSGLGGGCSLPVAALAEPQGDGELMLHGFVGAVSGETAIRVSARGAAREARALGARLAEEAMRQGAAALLQ